VLWGAVVVVEGSHRGNEEQERLRTLLYILGAAVHITLREFAQHLMAYD
jgi:hypothetical protein